MSLPPASGPVPAGTGPTTRGQQLHVSADLRVGVTAPDGRSAQVVLRDDGGTLRVVLGSFGDLRVVGASLPGGLAGAASRAARLARSGTLPVPPWTQDVEVAVGASVLLRRRDGRWSPTSRLAGPAAAATAGALVLLGAVGLLVAAAARRRRG